MGRPQTQRCIPEDLDFSMSLSPAVIKPLLVAWLSSQWASMTIELSIRDEEAQVHDLVQAGPSFAVKKISQGSAQRNLRMVNSGSGILSYPPVCFHHQCHPNRHQ